MIAAYYEAPAFQRLRQSTQSNYRRILEPFREDFGLTEVGTLKPEHIRKLIDKRGAKTPVAANSLLKLLRIILGFAVERGWRPDDPTTCVKRIRVKSDGFHSWTEEEIAAFERRHPKGTKPRLALTLLLYTAQRRGDVVTLGRQHVRGGKLRLRQQKTGKALTIPVHPVLAAELDRVPADQLTYLVTQHGKPYTAAGFTNWFHEATTAAGLERCSAHGLRKAASRRLAEAGASASEIAAMTGHDTLGEVARYTAAADQERLADAAAERGRARSE